MVAQRTQTPPCPALAHTHPCPLFVTLLAQWIPPHTMSRLLCPLHLPVLLPETPALEEVDGSSLPFRAHLRSSFLHPLLTAQIAVWNHSAPHLLCIPLPRTCQPLKDRDAVCLAHLWVPSAKAGQEGDVRGSQAGNSGACVFVFVVLDIEPKAITLSPILASFFIFYLGQNSLRCPGWAQTCSFPTSAPAHLETFCGPLLPTLSPTWDIGRLSHPDYVFCYLHSASGYFHLCRKTHSTRTNLFYELESTIFENWQEVTKASGRPTGV